MISSRPDIAYANEASKKKQSRSLHKIITINYTARNNKIIAKILHSKMIYKYSMVDCRLKNVFNDTKYTRVNDKFSREIKPGNICLLFEDI